MATRSKKGNNYSDYTKPRTNLFSLTPEVYKSDTNLSVFENLFNRFLTKTETKKVDGFLGDSVGRQVREPTLHRQGFQLQPIVNGKVGTIENLSSWKDIQSELGRLGVDMNRWDEWGNHREFNWVPPIDLDKLINYQNYYWVDNSNSSSLPDYVTIKNPCASVNSLLMFWQGLIAEWGSVFPIVGVDRIDESMSDYSVVSTSSVNDTITVEGDATSRFISGDGAEYLGSPAILLTVVGVTYDPLSETTMVEFLAGTVSFDETSGTLRLVKYDKLVFDTDLRQLFVEGFELFVRNSSNVDINDTFNLVISSTYDVLLQQTTVNIDIEFDDSTADGEVSLEEQENIYLESRDCLCSGSSGWDAGSWEGGTDELWEGNTACVVVDATTPSDPWINNNFWVHKTEVISFATAKRAEVPIIEFASSLELNEWTYTNYIWKYRATKSDTWELVEQDPTTIEFRTITGTVTSTNQIRFDSSFGDLLDEFQRGFSFGVEGVGEIYVVDHGEYSKATIEFNTYITTETPLALSVGSSIFIRPVETSRGDSWLGFYNQWLFVGADPATPINHQPEITDPIIQTFNIEETSFGQYNIEFIANEEICGQLVPIVFVIGGDHSDEFPVDSQFRVFEYGATIGSKIGTYVVFGIEYLDGVTRITVTDTIELDVISIIQSIGGVVQNLVLTFSGDTKYSALIGENDVRVYVNGARQYGTYDELGEEAIVLDVNLGSIPIPLTYVKQIAFLEEFYPKEGDVVEVFVGSLAPQDIGLGVIFVRMEEDDDLFVESHIVSLISYRKAEQVKSDSVNQFPLFDLYSVFSQPVGLATKIWGYQEHEDEESNFAIGRRIVEEDGNFCFEQYLVSDDGTTYAYRDYEKEHTEISVDTDLNKILFWIGTTWYTRKLVGDTYVVGVISEDEPTYFNGVEGTYWYDLTTSILKQRGSFGWDTVAADTYSVSILDPTLRTIWRKGTNNEEYVPARVDWKRRTSEEYFEEKEAFIVRRVEELLVADPTLSPIDARVQAEEEWLIQDRVAFNDDWLEDADVVQNEEWAGDWEVPDPLYFNNLHENRKNVCTTDIITHFTSIINNQPRIPGYRGSSENMFHLLDFDDVNYGLGGTIKEYNDGFDNFLSSVYTKEVTPPTLFDFAHNQYENQLVQIKEIFRDSAPTLMTSDDSVDFRDPVANAVILAYELNDNNNLIYGDSTTFTDVVGSNDIGVRGWIATLPYFGIVWPVQPYMITADIMQVVHHDGHRGSYSLTNETIRGIIDEITVTPDTRIDPPGTYGVQDTAPPPATIGDFVVAYGSQIESREGVYWFDQTTGIFYRLSVVAVSPIPPPTDGENGSLWVNTVPGFETLNVLYNTLGWQPAPGLVPGDGRLFNDPGATLEFSAWEVVDINEVLSSVILEVESRLYENVPNYSELVFDFGQLTNTPENTALYNDYLADMFASHVLQSEIEQPFSSAGIFNSSDPFTWNYKRSVPGIGVEIASADGDFFIVRDETGSTATAFPGGVYFHVKNSADGNNDGTWLTSTNAVWNGISETTIYVDISSRLVVEGFDGTLYYGFLPSPQYLDSDNRNAGGESGGDWRDWYEKLYGTPYPHLEPWVLQGYDSKPDWWDDEYLNNFPEMWGDRRWKYKHGFEIVSANATANTFTVRGVFDTIFQAGFAFTVDRSVGVHDGSYVVVGSLYDVGTNTTAINVGSVATSDVEGRIAVAHGMWENIRNGIIPASRPQPIFGIPEYFYFSVNIDNVELGGIESDGVMPPYWDYLDAYNDEYGAPPTGIDNPSKYGANVVVVSAPLFSFTQVGSISVDYAPGDSGPVEWEWKASSQFLYDQLTVAYRMQPVRLINQTFGTEFVEIDGLLFDGRTENTFCHCRVDFHGEVLNDNEVYKTNGINQWYVNYNRFFGVDVNYSDFMFLWTEWTAPLTYQFATFVDGVSFDIDHKNVDITPFDYAISAKHSPAVADEWIDSFRVSILSSPPQIMRYNNEAEWELQVTTNSNVEHPVTAYHVQVYPFWVNPETNQCVIYAYDVIGVNVVTNDFKISGNHVSDILTTPSMTFEIFNSTGNDGMYTVISAVYDSNNDRTIIDVADLVPANVADGVLRLNYRTLPWETGVIVDFETTDTLPYPLVYGDRYFFIKDSDYVFRIAFNKQFAADGVEMDLTDIGRGEQKVGLLRGTFVALDGAKTDTVWRNYYPDRDSVPYTVAQPYFVKGIQRLIDFVDGYNAYQKDRGFRINLDHSLRDPDTSRVITWQLELERWIVWAFSIRNAQRTFVDKFPIVYKQSTSQWEFTAELPVYTTGEEVKILSNVGNYPEPLSPIVTYFLIRVTRTAFQFASNLRDAELGNPISITYDSGADYGDLALTPQSNFVVQYPTQEINPFRDAIWFMSQFGIVSNVIDGPTSDIRARQLLFDQYGRNMNKKQSRIYRQDKVTKVQIAEEMKNDEENILQGPYNYIHCGGWHVFVDTYEHVLIFNDYTTGGSLVYDPFIGLNLSLFDVLFNRQPEDTRRPNVGGQFLHTFFNQNPEMLRNMEASADDLRYLHDTNKVIETNLIPQYSRTNIGYDGSVPYFDDLNISKKSQFLFWKGQIQRTGARSAISPIANLQQFEDIIVDEFWAYKMAEFGSAYNKEYLEMLLQVSDARGDILRFFFSQSQIECDPGYSSQVYDSACGYAFPAGQGVESVDMQGPEGSDTIALTNQNRWWDQPDQVEKLADDGGVLFFDLKANERMDVLITFIDKIDNISPIETRPDNQAWYDAQNGKFYRWDATNKTYVYNGGIEPLAPNGGIILRHDMRRDLYEITVRLNADGAADTFEAGVLIGSPPIGIEIGTQTLQLSRNYIVLGDSLTVFRNGVELINGTGYTELPKTGSLFLGDSINLASPMEISDVVEVIFGVATLSTCIHHYNVNSNVLDLLVPEIFDTNNYDLDPGDTESITIWGFMVDKEAQNPANVIDKKSKTVITPVQMWDPARGYHHYRSLGVIDSQRSTDPAIYTDTIESVQGTDVGHVYYNPWNVTEKGTSWLNTETLDYVPYFDPELFTNYIEQTNVWGRLADWVEIDDGGQAIIELYEWTESDVLPEEWNALAVEEEGNLTISESIRKSGVVKQSLFENVNYPSILTPVWERVARFFVDFDVVIEGEQIIEGSLYRITLTDAFISETEIIASDMIDAITNISNLDSCIAYGGADTCPTATSGYAGEDTPYGGPPPDDGMRYGPYLQVTVLGDLSGRFNIGQDVLIEDIAPNVFKVSQVAVGTLDNQTVTILWLATVFTQVDTGDEAIPDFVVGRDLIYVEPVNTYLNGRTYNLDEPVDIEWEVDYLSLVGVRTYETKASILVENSEVNDRVRVFIPIPTGDALQKEIDGGRYQQVYEYTTSDYYDDFGILRQHYYFWVRDKSTKPVTKDISIRDAVAQMVNIPTPYMVFIEPSTAANIEYGTHVDVPISWDAPITEETIIENPNRLFVPLGVVPKDGEVFVYVNTVSNPIPYELVGRELSVDTSDLLTGGFNCIGYGGDSTCTNPIAGYGGEELPYGGPITDEIPCVLGSPPIISVDCECLGYGGPAACVTSGYGYGTDTMPYGGEAQICAPITYSPSEILSTLLVRYTADYINVAGLPLRYQNVVIRGLRGLITDNDRFVMRFTRDFTLRDNLNFGKSALDLKDLYEEWRMIREKQNSTIVRTLWDKITESMIGQKLDDSNVRVPTLDRELYDESYGRHTRRGLGDEQAFVDGDLAKATILFDLNNPDNDFYPTDMDLFLTTYPFDSVENITEAMNEIYTKFSSENVNRMFFEVLHDALSGNPEYADIFKTSWLSVRVVERLNVGGKIIV